MILTAPCDVQTHAIASGDLAVPAALAIDSKRSRKANGVAFLSIFDRISTPVLLGRTKWPSGLSDADVTTADPGRLVQSITGGDTPTDRSQVALLALCP